MFSRNAVTPLRNKYTARHKRVKQVPESNIMIKIFDDRIGLNKFLGLT